MKSYLEYDRPKKKKIKPVDTLFIYAILLGIFIVGFMLGVIIGSTLAAPTIIYQEPPKQEEAVQTVEIPMVEEVYTPEPVYAFTDDEMYLMAQLLCGQAGKDGDGEYDFEWQIAKDEINWFEINKVLEVVMNRTLTPGIYADNVTDVIMQPGAFSVMPRNASREPSPEVVATVKYWCDSFNSPEYVPSIPNDHYWFSGSRGSNITRDHW
ncbi:MAG: cell wall hydrolase [Oscillospiraceae bacterium]|nr:cell wall hydrolase [Oscillospiraceae bacterium]